MKVDPRIEKEWLTWQKEEHIPEIMSTQLFDDNRFFRLLEQEEDEGITYVVQYFTSSMERYQRYIEEFSPSLRKKALERWGDRFVAFRTIMEEVNVDLNPQP